jgi:hypothetical protein
MVVALLAVLLGLAAPAPERTVTCRDAVERVVFPYRGGPSPAQRYRTVLGSVSMPPAHLPEVSDTRERPWRYWRKQGIVVRAGASPVSISVPPAWSRTVAIDWGNAGRGGPYARVRFARCGPDARRGNAYVGGFSLTVPSACVPLVVRVGGRSATVLVGIGRRCPR